MISFFFFFGPHPRKHAEVPLLGVELALQQQSQLQQWQCWNVGSLTCGATMEIQWFHSFFFGFLGMHCGIWKLPVWRSNQSYSSRPTSQPQQWQTWAISVTYTIAHGNAKSLTYWVRPGIKPASSWLLVRFISTEPWWGLCGFILIENNF